MYNLWKRLACDLWDLFTDHGRFKRNTLHISVLNNYACGNHELWFRIWLLMFGHISPDRLHDVSTQLVERLNDTVNVGVILIHGSYTYRPTKMDTCQWKWYVSMWLSVRYMVGPTDRNGEMFPLCYKQRDQQPRWSGWLWPNVIALSNGRF